MPIRQTINQFDPLEIPSAIFDVYQQNLDLMVQRSDGMLVPVFQSLEPEICKRRREIIYSRLGFKTIDQEITDFEARGYTSAQIGKIMRMSSRSIESRKYDIHQTFGHGTSNVTSSIISAIGLIGMQSK